MARKKKSKSQVVEDDSQTSDVVEEHAEETLEEAPAELTETTEEVVADEPEVPNDEPDAVEPVYADEYTEGSSLSSKVLTGLALLFVGGGIALWGGPKIAPSLPAGLAPVANFLSPGDSSSAQTVSDLQTQLEAMKTELAKRASADDVAALQSSTASSLTEIRDQLNATDGEEIEARLAEVETKLAGTTAQLSTLTDSLTGVQESTEGLSAEAATQITAYKAQIQGLMAEIESLSSQQGSLAQRIDDVSVVSERKVAEAEEMVSTITETAETRVASAQIKTGLASLAKAIEAGAPLGASLDALTAADVAVPEALSSLAEVNFVTLAELKSDFSAAAHTALKASMTAGSDASVGSRLSSFLKSQVTVRSLEPKEGDDADAVLSRMQGHLDNDRLADAVGEADQLQDAPKQALAGWLEAAGKRVSAANALQELQSQFDE